VKIDKKHILIIGKTELERRNLINELIKNSNLETFRFPLRMKSSTEYFDFCSKYGLYQDWQDTISHIGWISENESLIVLEEFQFMEEIWNIEIINCYLEASENRKKGQITAKVVISQNEENGLLKKLEEKINLRENEKRTKRQIIAQNIEIINI